MDCLEEILGCELLKMSVQAHLTKKILNLKKVGMIQLESEPWAISECFKSASKKSKLFSPYESTPCFKTSWIWTKGMQ